MPFYHKLGRMPQKKHITFYKPDSKSLYREELFSTEGFSSIYSTKYHIYMPTQTLEVKELKQMPDVSWNDAFLMHYHFFTDDKRTDGDFLNARNLFLHNSHCHIYTANPTMNPDYFYKNAYGHEYIFVHHGMGTFISEYGKFQFKEGDQILVPKGVIFQMFFDDFKNNKLLIVESDTPYEFPAHYINNNGQLLEDAPLSERDIKLPEFFDAIDEQGKFSLFIKAGDRHYEYIIPNHPYDLVGWDGYLYPWAFNIEDYQPKVAQIHLPPPVHQLFKTGHFVLCNFCPRLFDFHPQAIPAPYFHSNVDSAEVLYYVEGDFMSRKGIKEGSITLHPMGIPHGPQPGKTEASVGAARTDEYAVMIDTFAPLYPTKNVEDTMDRNYYRSWLD